MARYKNGQLPPYILQRRGDIRLTEGTWAKWDRLVSLAKEQFGVTLTITQGSGVTAGSGGYRDLEMQKAVRKKYADLGRPNQAATPGTSSHGGVFRGRDSLAIDINNYWRLRQEDLFRLARSAGFVANYFDGKGGRPNEPWHLIDEDPYRVIPTKPVDTVPALPFQEEDNMATGVIYTDDNTDKARSGAIVNTESGLFSAFGWFTKPYANSLAKGFGLPQAGEVTRGQYDQIRKDMAELRALRKG